MAAKTSTSWRTSTTLLVFTATLGLFTETFLYGFVVPIIPYMIEQRLGFDPAYTQRFTNELLFILGLISIPAAPIIGRIADGMQSRKIPLLISLAGCTVGTALVATTISAWAVYVGRILQGIAGTGAYIVGFAMLTDAAGSKHLGKALGLAGSIVVSGVMAGPAVSGIMLEWFGYWQAWSVPFALLFIDFVSRLAMVEQKPQSRKEVRTSGPPSPAGVSSATEDTPLLGTQPSATRPPRGFYRLVLSRGRTWAAMLNVAALSIIIAGFEATFPLHLRDTFGWGPAPVGTIFLAFQLPSMLFSIFIGWIRDRVGLRWPTAIGWILLAPLLWFAGVPDKSNFLGIGAESRGRAAFIATIIAIGIVSCLIRGAGRFELTSMLHELQGQDPEVFGPNGGSNRMISLTEISFNTGLMIGPMLCGSLADRFGFYYTSCALAVIAVLTGAVSFVFFSHRSAMRDPLQNS